MSGRKGFFGSLFSGKQSEGCCNLEITEDSVKKETDAPIETSSSSIIVLGTGCANCKILQANVEAAVAKLGLDMEVRHISDIQKIMEYGVMSVPALVLDQKVVSVGKVLKTDDIIKLLEEIF